jgi:L-alanine-DL-glutamate epimerase-like enolase superfamily enzyme
MDPRPVEKITAFLHGLTRQSPYGINQQAIAAIENALVDVKAKALGIPVYELLGGPVRDRLRLYWSHCGTWRVSFADRIKAWTGFDPIRSLTDVERVGAEVAARGFKGLKTNILLFEGPSPRLHMPGFNGGGWPELNIDRPLVDAITAELGRFAAVPGRGWGCTSGRAQVARPTSAMPSEQAALWLLGPGPTSGRRAHIAARASAVPLEGRDGL